MNPMFKSPLVDLCNWPIIASHSFSLLWSLTLTLFSLLPLFPLHPIHQFSLSFHNSTVSNPQILTFKKFDKFICCFSSVVRIKERKKNCKWDFLFSLVLLKYQSSSFSPFLVTNAQFKSLFYFYLFFTSNLQIFIWHRSIPV